jgi:hypothetical protein
VVIKNTRFKVIPTVDVWEPQQKKEDEELVVMGDPMTMIESHLNQLTMVESQLKKLTKDGQGLNKAALKLDLEEKKKDKTGNRLGWLALFKWKSSPSEPTPPPAPAPTVPRHRVIQHHQQPRRPHNPHRLHLPKVTPCMISYR